jgi:hypothetical protein
MDYGPLGNGYFTPDYTISVQRLYAHGGRPNTWTARSRGRSRGRSQGRSQGRTRARAAPNPHRDHIMKRLYQPTAQDFIDLLPIVSHQAWTVNLYTNAMRNEVWRCPICALAKEIDPGVDYQVLAHAAMQDIGVASPDAIRAVMNAADRPGHDLRARLLLALGIKEKS